MTQGARAVQCPGCGGRHEVDNPGIIALTCSYCQSYFYWDEQAVKDSGKKSQLDPPSSNLHVGARGTLLGESVLVLGRVRYTYGSGLWDEWFLEGQNRRIIWLSEDEKALTLEEKASADAEIPQSLRQGNAPLGAILPIAGKPFQVREVGMATCLGAEGQLPFVNVPGERYPFADLGAEDGSEAGIEYDEAGAPKIYIGHAVRPRDLVFEGELSYAAAGASQGKSGEAIRCPGCGASMGGARPADAEMVICEYCGAGVRLDDVESVLFKNDNKPDFVLAIGQKGRFEGNELEVVGRLFYVENDDGDIYTSKEYLLHSPDHGYRWLEESDGHYTLSAASPKHLNMGRVISKYPGGKINIAGEDYRSQDYGTTQLYYVDGALPWVAQVGERFDYVSLVAPPKIISGERSSTGESQEIEVFEGVYQSPDDIRVAFGLAEPLPKPAGVGAAQPFVRTPMQRLVMWASAGLAVANLFFFFANMGSGQRVLNFNMSGEDYRNEFLSPTFEVKSALPFVEIEGQASVDNSWIAVDIAVVDADERVVSESSGDASYYHGYEGGESWSEGSRSFSDFVRIPGPGTYKLLVHANAGFAESNDPSVNPQLAIQVTEGKKRSWSFFPVFLLALLYPAKEFSRRRLFEMQRSPGSGGDDDDDDWD